MTQGIRKREFEDLTLGTSTEDDDALDPELLEALVARNFPPETSNADARLAIDAWEDAHSILRIRETYNAREWVAVVALVETRLAVHQDEVEPHIHRIRAHYMMQDWTICIEACNMLFEIEENHIEGFRFVARCAKNTGDDRTSMAHYLRIIALSPTDVDALVAMIRHHYNRRDYAEVRRFARELIVVDASVRDGHLFMVRSSLALDDLFAALPSLEALLEMNPNDVEAVLEMGRTQFMLNEPELARSHLQRALELEPGERRAQRTLSLVYARLQEWELALELFVKECEIAPEMFSNWEKRINILYQMNKKADAKACLDHLFQLMGDTLEAYLMAYTVSASFYWDQRAESLLEEATRRWGGELNFHSTIASRSLDAGDLTKTLIHIRLGREVDSEAETLDEIESRMHRILAATETSLAEVEATIEDGSRLLHSECAIRNLSNVTSGVEIRRPRWRKRRLAMISSSLGRGGAERQVVTCLAGLVKERSITHLDMFCYALDKTGGRFQTYASEIEKIGVEIHEFGQRHDWNDAYGDVMHLLDPWRQFLDQLPPRMLREVEPLFLAFKTLEPDIVHAWQDQTNINVALAALMAGVPGIVMFARSLRPDGKTMMHMRNRPYLSRAYHALLKHPRILLCHNSEVGAKSYSDWMGIESNRFHVIHNGVDFDSIEESSSGATISSEMAEMGIPEGATIIGSVFRFVQEKQPRLWVDAVGDVMTERPDVHAVIVGDGGMMEATQSYIDECGLTNRIHLVGQTRQVKAWLDIFDIFLLTSRVEGLPNVLMEAQAFGVPVVSTDAGGSRDTYIDGETGMLVTDNSAESLSRAILKCLDDEGWMAHAQDRAREFAREKFSPETMLTRLMEIYTLSLVSQST